MEFDTDDIKLVLQPLIIGLGAYIYNKYKRFFRAMFIVLKRYFRNYPIRASMLYCIGPVLVVYALLAVFGMYFDVMWFFVPFLSVIVFTASSYLYLGNALQRNLRWSKGSRKVIMVIFSMFYAFGLIPYMCLLGLIILLGLGALG